VIARIPTSANKKYLLGCTIWYYPAQVFFIERCIYRALTTKWFAVKGGFCHTSLKNKWRLYLLVLSATDFLHDAPYLTRSDDKMGAIK
jgi:hypothetical protein